MKKIILSVMLLATAAFLASVNASKRSGKITVCHNGHVLTINFNAYVNGHFNHGCCVIGPDCGRPTGINDMWGAGTGSLGTGSNPGQIIINNGGQNVNGLGNGIGNGNGNGNGGG